jgi:hypothetical protein
MWRGIKKGDSGGYQYTFNLHYFQPQSSFKTYLDLESVSHSKKELQSKMRDEQFTEEMICTFAH